jgi:hypothetical protein
MSGLKMKMSELAGKLTRYIQTAWTSKVTINEHDLTKIPSFAKDMGPAKRDY